MRCADENLQMATRLEQLLSERAWCTKPRLGWVGVSFLASALGVFASGLPTTYPLYSSYMKEFFNLTQGKVSFISSVCGVGSGIHVPAAFMESRFGARWTLLVSMVVTCSGLVLMYLSFIVSTLRSISYLWLGFFVFLFSQGRTFTYLPCFSTAMKNTPKRHRAKVAALLDMVFELSSLVQFVCYYNIFAGTHVADFLLFSLVAVVVCSLICSPFVVSQPVPDVEIDIKQDGNTSANEQSEEHDQTIEVSAVLKSATARRLQVYNKEHFLRFLCSCEFLLLSLSMSTPSGICYFLLYNITHFTESLELTPLNQTLFTVMTVVVVLTRLITGATLDRFRGTTKFYWITIFMFILLLICQFSILLSLEVTESLRAGLFALAFVFAGAVLGTIYVFLPVLLSDIYGLPNFGRNLAIVYVNIPVLVLIVQSIYGHLYESQAIAHSWARSNNMTSGFNSYNVGMFNSSTNVVSPDKLNCVGAQCVRPTLLLTTALSALSLVMFIVLVLRLHDRCTCGKSDVCSHTEYPLSDMEAKRKTYKYKFVCPKEKERYPDR